MARKRTHTARDASSRVVEDFTRINGIGPITMKHLHRAGIHTFGELAALSAEGIASLMPNLSAKQVTRQCWIQRARELASSKAGPKALEEGPVISASRQHYENFTLEFLLSEKNKIRRLQIIHIQSGDVDTWPKWDARRLIDFLARHTGTHLPEAGSVVFAAVKPKPTFKPSTAIEQPFEVTTGAGFIPSVDKPGEKIDSAPSVEITESTSPILAPSDSSPSEKVSQDLPSSVVPVRTINRICLLEWKTLLSGTKQIVHNLSHQQCFDVNLTLDLTNASLPDTNQLDVSVSLYAKKLGNGPRQLIGAMQTSIPYASIVNLTLEHATLPHGLYRIEAFLTLVPTDSSALTSSRINASFQGGLFQVY